jgi:microcystin degradation protein MlrC
MSSTARLRVGLLGFSHEANSFAPVKVDAEYIRSSGIRRGTDLLEEYRGSESTTGGFIAAAEADADVDLVPLLMTTLIPAGTITSDALEERSGDFRDSLRASGPFDAVLVALHGAAVAEDVMDVDGHLLSIVRATVGPDVVIGVSLDLHANVSALMCEAADVLNTYRTNPHIDASIVAEEVARLVFDAARGRIAPVMAHVAIPAFINILRQNTSEEPMAGILEVARAEEAAPRILSVSIAEGYPYADVPEMGMSVVVAADGDEVLAQAVAERLAQRVWDRRGEFDVTAPGPDEAMALIDRLDQPVLLLDVGDNIGAGSPGDSVELLHAAILSRRAEVLAIVADRAAAQRCHEAGPGSRLSFELGSTVHAYPRGSLHCSGVVLSLSDGVFESDETLHAGFRHFDTGPSASFLLDTGQTVVIISSPVLPLTVAQFEPFGIDVADFAAVIAKGVHSPLAGYLPHVRSILRVDTAGVTSAGCTDLPYRHRRRPLYPLEPDATLPF